MAIIQTKTNSFLLELYSGVHAFGSIYRTPDTFKIALYNSTATLNASTTAYSATNEITGVGYAAGGQALAVVGPAVYGTTTSGIAYLNFATVIWNPASFTTAGALIYNSSQGNRSVCVLAFGNNITPQNLFTVTFPTNNQNNAIIRST